MTDNSPIVDEVRARASSISRRYGDDLRAYAAHLREVQSGEAPRVVEQITVVAADRAAGSKPSCGVRPTE